MGELSGRCVFFALYFSLFFADFPAESILSPSERLFFTAVDAVSGNFAIVRHSGFLKAVFPGTNGPLFFHWVASGIKARGSCFFRAGARRPAGVGPEGAGHCDASGRFGALLPAVVRHLSRRLQGVGQDVASRALPAYGYTSPPPSASPAPPIGFVAFFRCRGWGRRPLRSALSSSPSDRVSAAWPAFYSRRGWGAVRLKRAIP